MKRYNRDNVEKKYWKLARERTERLDLFDLCPTTVARIAYIQGLTDASEVAKAELKTQHIERLKQ